MAEASYWFDRTAQAIRDIVDEHGGAIIMTRAELCDAILEEDPHLAECPAGVMRTISRRITCCLRRRNMASRGYVSDKKILLVFDAGMTPDAARAHAEADGLSDAVQIELFKRQLLEVSA